MDEQERFWSKVDIRGEDDCWIWKACGTPKGYGIFILSMAKGKHIYAHRYAYQISKGAIPEGMHCMHKCDNPSCVNPNHLTIGTCADNSMDKVKKGRSSRGERRWCAKLTDSAVAEIRQRHASEGISNRRLAKEYGVSTSAISLVVTNRTWKHVAAGAGS